MSTAPDIDKLLRDIRERWDRLTPAEREHMIEEQRIGTAEAIRANALFVHSTDMLLRELGTLTLANEKATSWGAAVGARGARIGAIKRELARRGITGDEP